MTNIVSILYPDRRTAEDRLERRLGAAGVLKPLGLQFAVGGPAVARAIAEALDTPVGRLAADAWARSDEVQQACRRTAGRLGAREVVAMLEHSVKTSQAIEVEVDVNRARHVILTLTLRVKIDVKAVTVVVEAGRMAAIRPGVASTSATLSIGDIQVATGTLKDVSLDLSAASSRSAA